MERRRSRLAVMPLTQRSANVRHPLRKLSFSLLLSDPDTFEGGDLAFPTGPFAAARAQGTLALFPSFLLHRITPVAAGDRHAVVGYVLGPTFT